MEKHDIVSYIETQLKEGKITRDDLRAIAAKPSEKPQAETSRSLIKVFYAIGATIVVIGVAILLAEHWDEIGFVGRIFFSLGVALITYIAALLMRERTQRALSQVLFIISAALAPFGVFVFLREAGIDFGAGVQATAALILAVIYGSAFAISRKNILTLVTLGFVTWTYYAVIAYLFSSAQYVEISDIAKWSTMIIGAAYLLLAYGYSSAVKPTDEADGKEKVAVRDIVNCLGALALLGAGIAVGGLFDLVYIAFIFAAFYGSVYLKSRAMLFLGAIFLMAHIIKLTSKYFAGSIGWPIALIIVGFLIIGVGYLALYLNRKYIAGPKSAEKAV